MISSPQCTDEVYGWIDEQLEKPELVHLPFCDSSNKLLLSHRSTSTIGLSPAQNGVARDNA
jgi:hypothetical protein